MKKPVDENLRQPAPACYPVMTNSELAARYVGARVGGDFFDMVMVGDRLILLVLDVSGRREVAFHIAAMVQVVFRYRAEELFSPSQLNEADRMTQLMLNINRAIIELAGGAHLTTGFIACYEQTVGTLCYIGAGYPPVLLRDSQGLTELNSDGLPLGLFMHAAHDAQMTVVAPGAALLLYSRGIVEAWTHKDALGLNRVRDFFRKCPAQDAHTICAELLQKVQTAAKAKKIENDLTAICLTRLSARAVAGC